VLLLWKVCSSQGRKLLGEPQNFHKSKKGPGGFNKAPNKQRFTPKSAWSPKSSTTKQAHIMEAINMMVHAAVMKIDNKKEDNKNNKKIKNTNKGTSNGLLYFAARDSDNDSLGDLSEYLKQLHLWPIPNTTSVMHRRSSQVVHHEVPMDDEVSNSSNNNLQISSTTSYDYCYNCSNKCIVDNEIFVFRELKPPPQKKHKTGHYTAEIIIEIKYRNDKIAPIRALLDTGTSSSIVLREFVRKGRAKSYKGQVTTWSTYGRPFQTKRKALIDF
jgi:hypothetical protein